MTFSRSFRPDQQHDPVWPFGPTIDQRQRCGIGRAFQKIIAGKALRVRQRKRKLTGFNAA
jgi:hypothetical protein